VSLSVPRLHVRDIDLNDTAIPIITEGHETAFNGFQHQFTSGKPLKNLKPALNYYGNGSIHFFILTSNSENQPYFNLDQLI
jgi:hypothetical protein